MPTARTYRSDRRGGVYIVVLGTALIVSVLGLAALVGQRIQNRMLTASADITQARINAETAIELGLLEMKQNANWRTTHTELEWFDPPRATGAGECGLEVNDADALLGDVYDGLSTEEDSPVQMMGIGRHGPMSGDAPRTAAEQRVEVVVVPRREPLDCLRSGMESSDLPDWNDVFAEDGYYRTQGTQIAIDNDNLGPPELARNPNFDLPTLSPYWMGEISGLPVAEIQRIEDSDSYLRVFNREDHGAGAAQRVGPLIKPGKPYIASVNLRVPLSVPLTQQYRISFHASPGVIHTAGNWQSISPSEEQTITVSFIVPNFIPVNDAILMIDSENGQNEFYLDDLTITEDTTEIYIYRQVLGPNQNPFGTPNPNGVYWINCGGTTTLVIERSRIVGTLLVLNPGPNSRIGNAPIHWSPAVPGYPALLVNGNFAIEATNADLREADSGITYNPSGAPYFPFGAGQTADDDLDDVYPWTEAIRGLIAVSGDLSYQNTPRIVGQVVVGGTVSGAPNFEYRANSLLSPPPSFYNYRYERRPGSVRKAVLP